MAAERELAEAELKKCEDQLMILQESINEKRNDKAVDDAIEVAGGDEGFQDLCLKKCKHFINDAKVSATTWWPNSEKHLLTILQDGKMIFWDATTGTKSLFLTQNTWLMCGDFSYDGKQLAVAGLDNFVTIHSIPDLNKEVENPVPAENEQEKKSMEKHGGYIGNCKWLSNTEVVSGSGDKAVMLWDIATAKKIQKEPENIFTGHGLTDAAGTGDVASVDTYKGEENTFITGASDMFAKLWDKRVNCKDQTGATGNVQSFSGHTDNINNIKYLPGGMGFVTASDDGTVGMFDLRSSVRMQEFTSESGTGKCTAVGVSQSGRFIVSGYNDGSLETWDVLNPLNLTGVGHTAKAYHTTDVTSIELSPDGACFSTSSREMANNTALWA